MIKKLSFVLLSSVLPLVAAAQTAVAPGPDQGIQGVLLTIQGILNMLVPILISVAVVYLIWEIFQYTIAGDEDKKSKAKSGIVWGIVGLFVMVSIWGLVYILIATFHLQQPVIPINPLPQPQV